MDPRIISSVIYISSTVASLLTDVEPRLQKANHILDDSQLLFDGQLRAGGAWAHDVRWTLSRTSRVVRRYLNLFSR